MNNTLIDVAALSKLAKTRGPEARAAEDVARHALVGRFIHAPGVGWLAWDGKRWTDGPTAEPAVHDEVRKFCDQVERAHRAEAAAMAKLRTEAAAKLIPKVEPGLKPDEALIVAADWKRTSELLEDARITDDERTGVLALNEAAWAAQTQADIWLNLMSAASISNLTKLASRMESVRTDHRLLDAHPDHLNVQNGIVDLRTGQLHPHSPTALMTKISAGNYTEGAYSHRWMQAWSAVHPELRDWLWVRLGQAATGHRPDDDVLFVCWGAGANGKTTVLNAVRNALGDYAGLVPHKALMGASADAHTTELTTFRGLRMALMEETPEEGHLDMHRVKATVGTPTITARKMRQDDIEFQTTHTLFVNTNHRPEVTGADHGTWRRLVAVPWPYTFVSTDQVGRTKWHVQGDRTLRPDVVDRPSLEMSTAIVTFLVMGAQAWYAAGQTSVEHPGAVQAASEQWRTDSDMALRFATDYLVASDRHFILASTMSAAFSTFIRDEQGKRDWSTKTLSQRLGDALESKGIHLDAHPAKPARIRTTPEMDIVSDPLNSYVEITPEMAAKVHRMWRGVRFRTKADDAKDALAAKAAS